jgi:uncharacterized membrane protein YsdA (DUF1294 family)/cold shock CspA family protein
LQRGELVQWNDSRGFGFIVTDDNQRYFVHISKIGRIATRPRAGDLVSFTSGIGKDGRLEARSVSILGANPKPSFAHTRRGLETRASLGWRFYLALLLVGLLFVGLFFDQLPWPLAGAYAAMGLFSFLAYGRDKQFAEGGQWRISEVTLLGLDLCFGVVGGLLGQDIFRHKTRKPGYVATTLLISAVHLLWIAGFAFGLIRPEVFAELGNIVLS